MYFVSPEHTLQQESDNSQVADEQDAGYNSEYNTQHLEEESDVSYFMENIHSSINFKEAMNDICCTRVALFVFNIHVLIGFTSYLFFYFQEQFIQFSSSYIEMAMTPNLPFCEQPFAMTPYMAQGASALAHMPYIPLFLLGVANACPGIIPAMDSPSHDVRGFLWSQTMLQLFTSVGGHILPNPRMVMNQEISILLAFVCLFRLLELTTPSKSKELVNWRLCAAFGLSSVVCYLTVGLMPVIFTCFIAAITMGTYVEGAFGLLTPRGNKVLLAIFLPTALVLVVESTSCEWLQTNVSSYIPWHLLFDVLFWQVLGSALDVIVISPRPGIFLLSDS